MAEMEPIKPVFFANASEFRAWLEQHHEEKSECWVGFYKKGSEKTGITWAEAVGEALCFGWIDGLRKRIDDTRYMIRFSPRKPNSVWSKANVKRVEELKDRGKMRPEGLRAYAERKSESVYSYEQKANVTLDEAAEQTFRSRSKAWDFFQNRPEWYKRAAIWWVVSGKKEETRKRRLDKLIEDSERGQTLSHLTRKNK